MPQIPQSMNAWHLTGHGGFDKLQFVEIPVPTPAAGEVLIRVAAAALNNTDVNTRTGWYSKSVRGATDGEDETEEGRDDGSWTGQPLVFPRIQGADCCGHIVAVGEGISETRIGERVLVRALQRDRFAPAEAGFASWTYGSECDGGFCEYAIAFDTEALTVSGTMSDVSMAALPCAYGTAEGMLQRAGIALQPGQHALVTGASGGVGSAAVQLLERRGAEVTASASPDKAEALRELGADHTIGRDDALPANTYDAVVDLVAGPRWPSLLDALKQGGRYVTAGAIGGPIVELDVRTLYLRDLSLFGSTYQPENILKDVISYADASEINPMIAETWPLSGLVDAQKSFLDKKYIGKIVLDLSKE